MTASLAEILKKTLAALEANEEFREDAPAAAQLRRDIVRTIGELEIAKAAKLSDSTKLRSSESLKKVEPV